MAGDYIPRPDGAFDAWSQQFFESLEGWWSKHGYDSKPIDALKAALGDWQAAYAAHTAAQAAAEAAVQDKDEAREAFIALTRPLARLVQANPATTDADRADMGITVRSVGGGGTAPFTTFPVPRVANAVRLKHTITYRDSNNQLRTARPKGAMGVEVRLLLIDPNAPVPLDPDHLRYLALATGGSAEATFPVAAGGKTAVYMLRWVGKGGETGPWSMPATATVAA